MAIADLTPATRRAIAAVLAHREPLGFSAVQRLAQAEGASVGAVLVVTRDRGFRRDGWLARITDPAATIVVGDADTARALAGRADLRARLESDLQVPLDKARLMEHAARLDHLAEFLS